MLTTSLAPLLSYARTTAAVSLVSGSLLLVGWVALLQYCARPACQRTPLLDLLDDVDDTDSTSTKAERDQTNQTVMVQELEGIFTKHGLDKLWQQATLQNEHGMAILLTGCTGYVGKMVLFELLRHAESTFEKKKQKLVLLVRQRKGTSPKDRLKKIQHDPIFQQFDVNVWDWVELAETSGLEHVNCGMSPETLHRLQHETKITHMIHCAADVTFDRELPLLAGSNVRASLQMQAFCREWKACQTMVYVSTAFVNPTCGTPDQPMPEALYSLGNHDPQKLYQSMISDQVYANQVKAELGFQNNYVFSKCVGEHLLCQDTSDHTLTIVRPGIVGPSFILPTAGWNGERPSTATGLALLFFSRLARFALLSRSGSVPIIPVDVVATGIVHALLAGYETGHERLDHSTYQPQETAQIKNFVFSAHSPRKMISTRDLCDRLGSWASLMGLIPISFSAIYHGFSDFVERYPSWFGVLHTIFNRGPLTLFAAVQNACKLIGIPLIPELEPHKILKLVDMVDGYKPFIARSFYFDGSMHLPASFDPNRYLLHIYMATEFFYSKIVLKATPKPKTYKLPLVPPGRFDLWWALTQPKATVSQRVVCFGMAKWLRWSSHFEHLTIDLRTMAHSPNVIAGLESLSYFTFRNSLSDNHKEWLDWALALYTEFSYPMLGLRVMTDAKKPGVGTYNSCNYVLTAALFYVLSSNVWAYAMVVPISAADSLFTLANTH